MLATAPQTGDPEPPAFGGQGYRWVLHIVGGPRARTKELTRRRAEGARRYTITVAATKG